MANLANVDLNDNMNSNLKITNLPSHYNDQDIIQGLQRLIQNESICADFKKIIFKRNRTGKVSLFIKFANKHHVCSYFPYYLLYFVVSIFFFFIFLGSIITLCFIITLFFFVIIFI